MTLVDQSLRNYGILERGDRKGDASCLLALELMAYGTGPDAIAAARYCKKVAP